MTNTTTTWWRLAVTVAAALTVAGGCAGDVGKYRDAVGTVEGQPTGDAGDLSFGVGAVEDGGLAVAGGGATGGAASSSSGSAARPAAGGAAGGGGAEGGVRAPAVGGGPGDTTGVSADTVAIGLFYPKTGAYTALARQAEAVVQAAFDEAGPIHGRRLVVRGYDDGTANASTIQVEERRAKDEVFGYMSIVSESNVVLAQLANQHRVPVVVGNMDQEVAGSLTYAFAVFTYWERQANILPRFIKNVLNGTGKRVGVVYENSGTAKNAKDAFLRAAGSAGLEIVSEQPIERNQSTCANQVANLQSARAEIVFVLAGPLGGICMLRDARSLGYRPTFTGLGATWNLNVVAAASGGAADGVRTLSTMTTLETPAGRHYAELMRSRGISGADEDDVMLLPYSLARTFIEALRRAGPGLSRQAFVRAFETQMTGFDSGYLPPPTFGPGNRTGPLTVGVTTCCTDGKWTTERPGWHATF